MAERTTRSGRGKGPEEPGDGVPDAAGPGELGQESADAPQEAEWVDAEVTDAEPDTTAGTDTGAGTGTGPATNTTGRTERPQPSKKRSQSRKPEGQGTPGRPATGQRPAAVTWDLGPRGMRPDEVRDRWSEAQGGFIDDPQQAVRDADALATEVAEAVVAEIESRRSELRSSWSDGADADTEALRISLRDYRTFVKRLIGDHD